jgi:hypothetical protein
MRSGCNRCALHHQHGDIVAAGSDINKRKQIGFDTLDGL